MSKLLNGIAFVLALVISVSSASADDVDMRIRFFNRAGITIYKVQGSSVTSNTWGRDRLGTNILPPGQSLVVDFGDQAPECLVDLKITFSDGVYVLGRHNVCEAYNLYVTYPEN